MRGEEQHHFLLHLPGSDYAVPYRAGGGRHVIRDEQDFRES